MPRAFSPDLDALSELAASFARAYPALAPRLAERSADPDVERLLEAFTYLTERIHEIVDSGSPTAAQVFGDLLSPELARPFPCATVVEIAAPRTDRITVPAGAEFDSIPIDGTRCRFRAWSSFDLVPWVLDDARIAWSTAEGQSINLSLRSTGGFGLSSLFPLRLHLSGDSRAALTLLLFLRCHLAEIALVVGDKTFPLGKAIRAWGLRADEALLPPEPFEHPGLRLLREYYVLPAKFAFVEIAPSELPEIATDRVEIKLRFDAQLPTTTHVTRENVRLNCVPVANVFETTTDPIWPTLERPTHLLRPAGLPLGHGETYSVTRVLARAEDHPGVMPVAMFSEFEAAPSDSLRDAFYIARALPTASGRGNEVHLSLGSPLDGGVLPAIEFLSVEVRADNGALPNALGIGDVSLPTESTRRLSFRNVSAVSTYRPPASGDELRWRTLAVTSLSALPLTNAETLQTLLHVLNLHPLTDAQAARAHAQRLAAILTVAASPARARHGDVCGEQRGTVVVGHDVRVDVSNTGFDGEGDALVFASVLSRVFAHETSLGTFARTTVKVVETGRVFTFPALHGDRMFEDG